MSFTLFNLNNVKARKSFPTKFFCEKISMGRASRSPKISDLLQKEKKPLTKYIFLMRVLLNSSSYFQTMLPYLKNRGFFLSPWKHVVFNILKLVNVCVFIEINSSQSHKQGIGYF